MKKTPIARASLTALLALASLSAHAVDYSVEPTAAEIAQITEKQEKGVIEYPDQCAPINFYDNPESAIWQIPIYDQNPSSTCYAFAASQMMDWQLKRYQHDPLQGNVNPIYVAYKHKEDATWLEELYVKGTKTRTSLEVSITRRAINDLRRMGMCSPAAARESIAEFTKGTNVSDGELAWLIENYWRLSRKYPPTADRYYNEQIIETMAANPDMAEDLDMMVAYRREIDATANWVAPATATPVDYKASSETLYQARIAMLTKFLPVLQRIITESPVKRDRESMFRFYRDSVFAKCKGSAIKDLELPEPKSIARWWASNGKILNAVDGAINYGNPAMVGYCAKTYKDEASIIKRKWLLPRGLRSALESHCAPHYSLIVGRRMNNHTNTCEYLLRNTKATRFWTRKFECLCQNPDGTKVACKADDKLPIDHDNSQKVLGCWVDSASLANSAFDVEWYAPQVPSY